MRTLAPTTGPAPPERERALRFEPRLQQVLCVLVAAAAIKLPLDIPLYLNALLLVLGLFAVIVVQSLQRIFLWMVALVVAGLLSALANQTLGSSGPRLLQLFLLLCAASVIARLEPALLARYLVLLLPVILLLTLVEGGLPDDLFRPRKLLGYAIPRFGGLQGDPNFSAILYGVIGVLLAQHRPRCLAILPFLLAAPMLSRGLIIATLAWIGTALLGRRGRLVALGLVALLCLQPLVVVMLDATLDDAKRAALLEVSSGRSGLWFAYARMGLENALGVGYFQGPLAFGALSEYLPPGFPPREAHSLYMQVFGEFGWVGYVVFVGFLLQVAWTVARDAPALLPVLVFLATGYALINGLSDWPFWVGLGYLLARARVDAAPGPQAPQEPR